MMWLHHIYWYLLGAREFRDRVTTGAPSRPLQESYNNGRRFMRRLTFQREEYDRFPW